MINNFQLRSSEVECAFATRHKRMCGVYDGFIANELKHHIDSSALCCAYVISITKFSFRLLETCNEGFKFTVQSHTIPEFTTASI